MLPAVGDLLLVDVIRRRIPQAVAAANGLEARVRRNARSGIR